MKARHDEAGEFEQMAPMLAGCIREQPVTHVRPPFETDTRRVLTAAGLGAQDVEALFEAGAVE
jgi:alpha-methylacyl-CoA racemase